ncbi:MAG: alpha/beta fold hydrolase [Candidatus Aminicenantes bacterium]|nr:alpha/beta fold hydrolase [Candidatus Aminicenantes bacterium]
MGEDNIKISTNTELFKTFDDIKLFEQSFTPEKDIKGIIVLIHGLTEHSGSYIKVSKTFAKHKYAVNLFDLRGHGKSDGPFAFMDSFEDFLDDLSVFLNIVKDRYPKKPVFLFGQGMGGILSTLYVIENKPDIRGLILSAPALQLNGLISPILQRFAMLLGRLIPRWPLIEIKPSLVSKDPIVVQAYEKDPLVYHGKIYARTCLELIRASKKVNQQANEIKPPVFIVHGREDLLFDHEGSSQFFQKLNSPDKFLQIYKGLSHYLLFGSQGRKVIEDIIQWADSHVRSS